MQEIINVGKKVHGVEVQYEQSSQILAEHFSYGELIDLRINVLDLLDHPERYVLDIHNHRVVEKLP
ncbi:MAG: hypothetical protein QCH35_01435 [Methanomicrobiaceae archaeon]|nr:hypothetical protein [Methanomicrobiaceae archaeon]